MPNIAARLRSYQCGIYQGDYSRFQSDWIQVRFDHIRPLLTRECAINLGNLNVVKLQTSWP